MLNKKGDEKLFSFWLFLMMGIVGVFVVGGVWLYYSAEVDIRQDEASILNEKLTNCLIENEVINKIINDNFSIFEKCDLNKDIFNENNNFYFNVLVYENEILSKEISEGQIKFKQDCQIVLETNAEAEKYPKCVKNVYFLEDKKIEILTASNNKGEKL